MAAPRDSASATPSEDTKQPLLTAMPLPALPPASGAGDLELRLLQAFGEYAGHSIVRSYSYIKHSSRVLGFVTSSTETVVTKAGLVALVRFFYRQYLRLGHPIVRYVDEAVGKCIVSTFVRLLLAVEYQQQSDGPPHALLADSGESLELTYYERLQALLYGQVPRLQAMVTDLYTREQEAKNTPPPVTFNPDDYVPKEQVERLQLDNNLALTEKEQKLEHLQKTLQAAELAHRRLDEEMKATDAARKAEGLAKLNEKEQQIMTLQAEIQLAAQAREQLKQELDAAQQQHRNERDEIVTQKEAELAKLKKQLEQQITTLQAEIQLAAEAREQLKQELDAAQEQHRSERDEILTQKEAELTTLKKHVEEQIMTLQAEIKAAALERAQLKQELEIAKEQHCKERDEIITQKEAELATLKKHVEQQSTTWQAEIKAATQARDQLKQELNAAQEQHRNERDEIVTQNEVELATLKKQVEHAEREREQLKTNLREALRLKEDESRQTLSVKEEQLATLKSEVQTAEQARKTLEQEFEATRVRIEHEHNQRVKELEEELARAKHEAHEKALELRASSLRQQRNSFDASLVKNYVQQAKHDDEQTKSPAASDNQKEHEALNHNAKSPTSSASSASPRADKEAVIKAKIEKEKLNARMRRVLGSRF